MSFIELYNLKKDKNHIEDSQYASLNKPNFGLKTENGLLFGSDEWFKAIEDGQIEVNEVHGTITGLRMVGMHNESREVEVTSDTNGEKTTWGTYGKLKYYQHGKRIEIKYVLQKLKNPDPVLGEFVKCILSYKVEH